MTTTPKVGTGFQVPQDYAHFSSARGRDWAVRLAEIDGRWTVVDEPEGLVCYLNGTASMQEPPAGKSFKVVGLFKSGKGVFAAPL